MDRRRFLRRGVGATPLLAGCLALPDGGGTPTPGRRVSIAETDDPPDLPVRPSVEVVGPDATERSPPVLHATVENTADHPIEAGEERAIVFAFEYSETQPGLVLLPTDDGEYESVEPGCWRLTDAVAVAEYYGIVPLEPGETTERRVGVWASHDGSGCLPTGRFRFSTQYAGARDRGEGIEEQEWAGRWGFTLAIA